MTATFSFIDGPLPDKRALFQRLLASPEISNTAQQAMIIDALMAREAIGDTCIAPGIALAHAQQSGLTRPICRVARLAQPLVWADDLPLVSLVFVLILPEKLSGDDQRVMRQLMHCLADEARCEALTQAGTGQELRQLLPLA